MNCILLAFILFFLLFFISMSNCGNFLSCSFISTVMFFISDVFYVLFINPLCGDLSLKTITVVSFAIFFIFVGEFITNFGEFQIKFFSCRCEKICLYISNFKVILFTLINFFVIYLKIKMLNQLGTQFGVGTNLFSIMKLLRGSITSGEIEFPVYMQLLSSVSDAVAYSFMFFFLFYLIVLRKKRLLLLLPVVSHLIMQIFSTGRSGFILFAIVLLFEVLFLINNKNTISLNKKNTTKVIKYVVPVVVTLAIFFYLYGNIVRGASHTFVEYLSQYIAAPLYGLNDYLDNCWIANNHLGQYTLQNFYYYLNKLGYEFAIPPTHLSFFSFGNQISNIYTSLVFPIQDYGITGLFLTRILIGIIYSCIIYKAQNVIFVNMRNDSAKIILASYMLNACVYSVVADKYRMFLTVTSFPFFVASVLFCIFICTKK